MLQMTKLDAGELHFGSGPALAARLVPEALRHFIQTHPGILTRLQVNNAEQLGQALRREQIEFSSMTFAPSRPTRTFIPNR